MSTQSLLSVVLFVLVLGGFLLDSSSAAPSSCPFRVGLKKPNLIVAVNASEPYQTDNPVLMKLSFQIAAFTFAKKNSSDCQSPLYIVPYSENGLIKVVEVDWSAQQTKEVFKIQANDSFPFLFGLVYNEQNSLLYVTYAEVPTHPPALWTNTQLLIINPVTKSYRKGPTIESWKVCLDCPIQAALAGQEYLFPIGSDKLLKYDIEANSISYLDLSNHSDFTTFGLQYDPITNWAYGLQDILSYDTYNSEIIRINITNGDFYGRQVFDWYQAGVVVRSAWLDVQSRLYFVLFNIVSPLDPSYNLLYTIDVTNPTWEVVSTSTWKKDSRMLFLV